jgi:hypothetical protein
MRYRHLQASMILAGAIALSIGSRAWGQERLTVAPGTDSNLSMARFYTGSAVSVGEFPGTLVRLSCAPNGIPSASGQVGKPGHDYALVVRGENAAHPLLAGTNEARRELSSVDLHGTEVAVHGKYYPSTGVILVSSITVPEASTVRTASEDQGPRPAVGSITDHDPVRLARCVSE